MVMVVTKVEVVVEEAMVEVTEIKVVVVVVVDTVVMGATKMIEVAIMVVVMDNKTVVLEEVLDMVVVTVINKVAARAMIKEVTTKEVHKLQVAISNKVNMVHNRVRTVPHRLKGMVETRVAKDSLTIKVLQVIIKLVTLLGNKMQQQDMEVHHTVSLVLVHTTKVQQVTLHIHSKILGMDPIHTQMQATELGEAKQVKAGNNSLNRVETIYYD